MIIERVFDLDRVYKVLKDPEIFSRIAEQGIDIDDYEAPIDAIYIMDHNNTCLMIYHWSNSITLECHVQVLKDYRETRASMFGKAALDWAWNNTNAAKIVAQIPECFPDVLKFAEKNGFVVEGINKNSYMRKGKLISQVYLGLSR